MSWLPFWLVKLAYPNMPRLRICAEVTYRLPVDFSGTITALEESLTVYYLHQGLRACSTRDYFTEHGLKREEYDPYIAQILNDSLRAHHPVPGDDGDPPSGWHALWAVGTGGQGVERRALLMRLVTWSSTALYNIEQEMASNGHRPV